MSRPKGSKNKQKDLLNNTTNTENNNELKHEHNAYQDYIQTVTEGFITKLFNDGIVKEVKTEDLVKYFSQPDQYHQELENISQYYYISNGDIFQQFDLARVLPSLNHKVEVFEKTKSYEKNISLINKAMNKVKHRTLTRDIISQVITSGTLVGIWLGDKKNPYLHIFDDIEYVFPVYRLNGEWIAWLDLQWFKGMKDEERAIEIENLSPYVTETDYQKYLEDTQTNRYIELPQEVTVVLQTHTNKRNQRLGIPWSTQGLMDIGHKKKLKDMEIAIANKIIKAVAVLKLGNERVPDPPKTQKQKVVAGVKKALTENTVNGTPVIAIPEWTDLSFDTNTNSNALDPKKFSTINSDIDSSLGTGSSMKNGDGGNFSSGKINFEIFYKKLAVLLEEIEEQVYAKLLNIVLPGSVADNYRIIYDKEPPVPIEKKLDILMKLHSEGYAIKPLVDLLSDIDYASYIEQSIYEIETLKLREKIIPPQLSYTTSGSDNKGGAPIVDNPANDNTLKAKTDGSNQTPRANV